jgi:hypothetical protein
MKPGDVQTSKMPDGKTVVLAVGVWAKRDGNWIHIRVKGVDNSITTVTNNPESIRRHPALFHKLRQTLISEACWPFGDEGAETMEPEVPTSQPHSSYDPEIAPEDPPKPRYQPIRAKGGASASEIILRDRGRF